jgi:hypothetical protein
MFKLQKHRGEDVSQISDDKVQNPCQISIPDVAGTDEPAHERGGGGSGSGDLPSVETDAPPGAGADSSGLQLDGLPTGDNGATGATDPAPDGIVPHEGGGGSGDLPSIEEDAPSGADGESSEAHLDSSPSVDTDAADPPSIPDDITRLESVPPVVFEQLNIEQGGKVLEAIVDLGNKQTPYIVACLLRHVLKHCDWTNVQSEKSWGCVYVKMHHADLLRFYQNYYSWDLARVHFSIIEIVLGEPGDAINVFRLR